MVISDPEAMLTVNQVAARLQLNPYTIRELLRNGDLIGFKIKNVKWRIKSSDLEKYVHRFKPDSYK